MDVCLTAFVLELKLGKSGLIIPGTLDAPSLPPPLRLPCGSLVRCFGSAGERLT